MFSYRHAFHAGNHADVLKHAILIAIVKYMTAKDAGLTIVDTHAGAGLYRLDGDYSEKGDEAREGVVRLFSSLLPAAGPAPMETIPPLIQDYLDLITGFNPDGRLKIYPGSPFVVQSLLRKEARDRLKLFEMHPTDSKALAGNIAQLEAGRQIAAARQDGFEGLKAFLPPPNRRGLVLIDPSYEIKSDYGKVITCIQDCLQRFATGTYVVWYPIIPRPEAHDLPRRLKTMAQQGNKTWLHATLAVGKSEGEGPSGLNASGMFVVNPPYTLKAQLKEALPVLLSTLRRGNGASQSLEGTG
jgi:23S rRNA (adenine2030-N6)-methyltransferase